MSRGSRKHMFFLLLIDVLIILCSYILVWMVTALQLDLIFSAVQYAVSSISGIICTITAIYVFRMNRTIWRYAYTGDMLKLFLASLFGGAAAFLITLPFLDSVSEKVSMGYATVFASVMLLLSRMVYQRYRIYRSRKKEKLSGKRLLIVGAGEAGCTMLNEIMSNPASHLLPVGLVDDDPEKQNRTINGVKVLGRTDDIKEICTRKNVEIIYIAIPSAAKDKLQRIINRCTETSCAVKILPYVYELDKSDKLINIVRDITPEQLLGRDPIEVANEQILSFINGKTIMVTGGGGSIGSEICRQVAAHHPKRLVIVDFYENTVYEVQQRLYDKYGSNLNIGSYIINVCEYERINRLMSNEKPDIVIHAAAHKHVPLMETVPDEAVRNNVFGTYNVVKSAHENGVGKFVLISTDKAVNPTNFMGATKRVCEMIVQYFDKIYSGTTFSAVRFGNVLDSHGSVVPLFKRQIADRRDITVTHPDITRYFMTIPEASQLVLNAGAMAKGGDLFVLDMGKPIKIDSMARKMVSLAGLTVGKDINIRYVGLRPGEKLYEEMLMSNKELKTTFNSRIFIDCAMNMDFDAFPGQLEHLRELAYRDDVTVEEMEKALMELVPSFKRYVPGSVTVEEKVE